MPWQSRNNTPVSPSQGRRYRYLPTAWQIAELALSSPVARMCTARFAGDLLARERGAPADLIALFVRLVDDTLSADTQRSKHPLLQRLSTCARSVEAEG